MGRAPCCSKVGLHRGPWSSKEDKLLIQFIQKHGEGDWRNMPKKAGLLRCGKSCRLRWMNYLRPDIKRGNITQDEEDLIIRLHGLLGNRWCLIAGRLPGRTDNEIKNYWNSHLSRKLNSNNNVRERPNHNNKPTLSKDPATAPSKDIAGRPSFKVHQPKAARVSPFSVISRNESFDNLFSGSSSSTPLRELEASRKLNDGNISSDGNEYAEGVVFPSYGFIGGNDYRDHLSPGCQIFIPAKDYGDDGENMLDKIFEEYEKFQEKNRENDVQLESFVDSFLMM